MADGTAKSFRAAAQRLVLQESSAPADALGLFRSTDRAPRRLAGEQDAWDLRLGSIAALGDYDAVACVATKPVRLVRSRSVAHPSALKVAIEGALAEVVRRGGPMQLRAAVPLADGRTATALLVVPIRGVEGVEAVLVAARAGRGFGTPDAAAAEHLADLLAVELARVGEERSSARTRLDAIALFELARIGLERRELAARLDGIVEMLAASLGQDVAQLWLLRGGGSLRLQAARPRESLALEIARPRDQAVLARALAGETVVVRDASLRFWMRRTTREVIVAPLRDTGAPLGLLIVGRWHERPAEDDVALAGLCADFTARIVALDDRAYGSPAAGHAVPRVDEGTRTGS